MQCGIIKKKLNAEEFFFRVLREDIRRNLKEEDAKYLSMQQWEALYAQAVKSGLYPVFYSRVSGLRNIPPEISRRFKNLFFLNLQHNAVLDEALGELTSSFQLRNIPVMPLKGPMLAYYLYQDLALRRAPLDLDFLVPQESMQEAEGLMRDLGYASLSQDNDGFVRSLKLKYAKQLDFIKRDENSGSIVVDLHWDLRGFFIPTFLEDFWQDTKELLIHGHRVIMPSDTNLLLYLALNSLSTFEFVELRYLYDIHMLIARSMKQEEWPEVLKKSRSWNLGCVLFFALALCQDLFNTPVPRDVLWQLRPHFLKRALLNIWINKRTILYHNQNIAASYTWRYFVSSYLYSRGILDCSRLMHKKIFLPAQEVMGFYHQPACGVSYRLYIKRLLKPITRYLRKGVVTHAKHAHLEKESQYCYTKN